MEEEEDTQGESDKNEAGASRRVNNQNNNHEKHLSIGSHFSSASQPSRVEQTVSN